MSGEYSYEQKLADKREMQAALDPFLERVGKARDAAILLRITLGRRTRAAAESLATLQLQVATLEEDFERTVGTLPDGVRDDAPIQNFRRSLVNLHQIVWAMGP